MKPDEVRRQWHERSGEYSPDYYAYYGPNETSELLRETLDAHVGSDAAVLELGCNVGRHLKHLADHGYRDLAGIELNEEALATLRETYPDLDACGTFYAAAIEHVVCDFDDDQFDAVYSVETLQHLHPDVEWVFDELVRITDDLLVTVENEGDDDRAPDAYDVTYVNDDFPLYYRDWNHVFTERGLVEVDAASISTDTFRAFRPPSR